MNSPFPQKTKKPVAEVAFLQPMSFVEIGRPLKELAEGGNAGFQPLCEIRLTPKSFKDAQTVKTVSGKISTLLTDDEGQKIKVVTRDYLLPCQEKLERAADGTTNLKQPENAYMLVRTNPETKKEETVYVLAYPIGPMDKSQNTERQSKQPLQAAQGPSRKTQYYVMSGEAAKIAFTFN